MMLPSTFVLLFVQGFDVLIEVSEQYFPVTDPYLVDPVVVTHHIFRDVIVLMIEPVRQPAGFLDLPIQSSAIQYLGADIEVG